MTFQRLIEPMERNIVDLLLQFIPYLSPGQGGTCKGVADIETAKSYTSMSTPLVLVKAGPEVDEDPGQIGSANQYCRQYWTVFAVAMSFTSDGEGREDGHGTYGIYSMLDDIDGALRGRKNLVGLHPEWKLYKAGGTGPAVEDQRVTASSNWWHRVHRREQVGS